MRKRMTPRNQSAPLRYRAFALCFAWRALLLLVVGVAAPAEAAETQAPSEVLVSTAASRAPSPGPSLAQKIQALYWRGRLCSSPACKAARPSSFGDIASFGLAAFGGVLISRRRAV